MSYLYDEYLRDHIKGVKDAIAWMMEHKIIPDGIDLEIANDHDISKRSDEEYKAYDDYFYGNKSSKVVEAFNYAWLHHIHHNKHHWQHWVLKHDDEPEEVLEMPERYVYEMIADWWSFSWKSKNLYEIFDWYEKHKGMILHEKTRKLVESTLEKIKNELDVSEGGVIEHHGIPGQKWGVKNGPPYPLDNKTASRVRMNYNKERGDDAELYKGQRTKKAIDAHPEENLEDLKRFDDGHAITNEDRQRINHPIDDYGNVGRSYNCQNCVAAFEMMERGYDVCAKPMPTFSNVGDVTKWFKGGELSDLGFENDVTKWDISEETKEDISAFEEDAKRYYSNTGKIPYSFELNSRDEIKMKDERINAYKMNDGRYTAVNKLYKTLSSQGDGARGFIIIGFMDGVWLSNRSNTRCFHAITYKVEDGNLLVYDPQSYHNSVGNRASKTYIPGVSNFDPRSLFYMRTDNLELNDSIASAVYSNKKG